MTDYYLDINGLSKHLNTPVEYNERNLGMGLTRETVDDDLVKMLTAGAYLNSFKKQTFYTGAGIAKRFGQNYYADVGIVGGVMTGYEETISPMAILYTAFGRRDLAKMRMMYAPETEKSPSLIMMNLGISF